MIHPKVSSGQSTVNGPQKLQPVIRAPPAEFGTLHAHTLASWKGRVSNFCIDPSQETGDRKLEDWCQAICEESRRTTVLANESPF